MYEAERISAHHLTQCWPTMSRQCGASLTQPFTEGLAQGRPRAQGGDRVQPRPEAGPEPAPSAPPASCWASQWRALSLLQSPNDRGQWGGNPGTGPGCGGHSGPWFALGYPHFTPVIYRKPGWQGWGQNGVARAVWG